jgi:hypothetical protein
LSKPDLNITLQDSDSRGAIYRADICEQERFLIIEIKKGKARGGHYHNIHTFHFVLLGSIEYYERCLTTKGEEKQGLKDRKTKFHTGEAIPTPAYAAHMLVALEDSIVIEPSGQGKLTFPYARFREMARQY